MRIWLTIALLVSSSAASSVPHSTGDVCDFGWRTLLTGQTAAVAQNAGSSLSGTDASSKPSNETPTDSPNTLASDGESIDDDAGALDDTIHEDRNPTPEETTKSAPESDPAADAEKEEEPHDSLKDERVNNVSTTRGTPDVHMEDQQIETPIEVPSPATDSTDGVQKSISMRKRKVPPNVVLKPNPEKDPEDGQNAESDPNGGPDERGNVGKDYADVDNNENDQEAEEKESDRELQEKARERRHLAEERGENRKFQEEERAKNRKLQEEERGKQIRLQEEEKENAKKVEAERENAKKVEEENAKKVEEERENAKKVEEEREKRRKVLEEENERKRQEEEENQKKYMADLENAKGGAVGNEEQTADELNEEKRKLDELTAAVQMKLKKLESSLRAAQEGLERADGEVMLSETKAEQSAKHAQNLQSQIAEFEALCVQKKQNIEDLERRLAETEAEYGDLHAEKADVATSLAEKETELEEALASITNLTRELDEAKTQINQKEHEYELLADSFSKIENSSDSAEEVLNMAKVRFDLEGLRKKHSQLERNFEEQETLMKSLEATSDQIKKENVTLSEQNTVLSDAKKEANIRLSALSEYFTTRELELQREIGEATVRSSQDKNAASSSHGRQQQLETELKSTKTQLSDLQRELSETETRHRQQLAEEEKRAHDNWLQTRQQQKQVDNLEAECAALRQQLNVANRTKGGATMTLAPPPPPNMMPPGMLPPPWMMGPGDRTRSQNSGEDGVGMYPSPPQFQLPSPNFPPGVVMPMPMHMHSDAPKALDTAKSPSDGSGHSSTSFEVADLTKDPSSTSTPNGHRVLQPPNFNAVSPRLPLPPQGGGHMPPFPGAHMPPGFPGFPGPGFPGGFRPQLRHDEEEEDESGSEEEESEEDSPMRPEGPPFPRGAMQPGMRPQFMPPFMPNGMPPPNFDPNRPPPPAMMYGRFPHPGPPTQQHTQQL